MCVYIHRRRYIYAPMYVHIQIEKCNAGIIDTFICLFPTHPEMPSFVIIKMVSMLDQTLHTGSCNYYNQLVLTRSRTHSSTSAQNLAMPPHNY